VRELAEVEPVNQAREPFVVQRQRRDELAPPRESDERDPVLRAPSKELLRDLLGDVEPVLRTKILAPHASRLIDGEHDVDSLAHHLTHLASRLRARGGEAEEE